ncbi:MAG: MBL fold metallo-hydrolase [Ruminococcaceae bacterium]|nr:MBL fold metallo-hydrolase [Oscillospiraceae bacterium]
MIELTFLGTCACDFSKKLQNEFKDCFDKDARRASSMMIADSCLVDCGVHVMDSIRIAKKDVGKITDIFVTHLHWDHYNRDHVAKIAEDHKVRLWVREDADIEPIDNVEIKKMKLFQKYEVREGFFVTGMVANHDVVTSPQHFIFEIDGKKIFYGCDGGWFINTTYNFLRDQKLDLAVLDCTMGDYDGDFRIGEHNGIPMIRLLLPSLKTINAIGDATEIYLSHLAPSLHKPHDETVRIAGEFGAKVAYDGLTVII